MHYYPLRVERCNLDSLEIRPFLRVVASRTCVEVQDVSVSVLLRAPYMYVCTECYIPRSAGCRLSMSHGYDIVSELKACVYSVCGMLEALVSVQR